MLNQIFLTGLAFLLYFSYQDIKYKKIEHLPILLFLVVGVIWTINTTILYSMPYCLGWLLLGGFLWTKKSIGGADVKIFSILPIYSNNSVYSQIIFLFVLAFLGLTYGLIAKRITRKRSIPLLPLITISYLVVYFTN